VNLTADTSPTTDDLLITVNDPSGTAANRKTTIANLFKAGDITITGVNTGIGVTSPTAKLDVAGAIKASGTVTGSNLSGTNTGDQTNITGNAATVTFADAAGDTTTFPALGTAATGSLAPATDAGLTYNATTNALTTTTFIGALTGNATTATALAANGTDCSVGSYARGVDASGNSESCTAIGTGLGSQWITTTSVGIGTTDNVGVGTTHPEAKLVVIGGNVGIGSRNPGAELDTTGTIRASVALVVGNGGTPITGDANGNVGIGTLDVSNKIVLGLYDHIDSNGNLGVGTAVAAQKLVVAGTAEVQGFKMNLNPSAGYVLTSTSVGVGTWMPASGGSGSGTVSTGVANYFAYYPASNTTVDDQSIMAVSANNIGIGSANAPNKLYVAGTIEGQGFKLNNGASAGYVLTSSSVGVGTWMPAASGSGVSGITTNYIPKAASSTSLNDSVMYQIGSNIGIGTTTAGQVLTVNGGVSVTGSGFTNFTSNVGINSASPGATLDLYTGTLRVGIGTITAGTVPCFKSISGGTAIIGYCTGSMTGAICGTCN
jgi:hypothetical protein